MRKQNAKINNIYDYDFIANIKICQQNTINTFNIIHIILIYKVFN